jgi:hypothetical protein
MDISGSGSGCISVTFIYSPDVLEALKSVFGRHLQRFSSLMTGSVGIAIDTDQ